MKHSIKKTALVFSVLWTLAISFWLSAQVSAQTVINTNANASVSVQDQWLIDMVRLKIDSLSLEDTKTLWTRRSAIKWQISVTSSKMRLVDWISEYIQMSVNEKMSMVLVENNIAELAMSNPDLSMLVDIVVYLDLADALMADGNMTVFAPTNEAFANALEALWITADQLMQDKELLEKIVMHHIIPMNVTAQDAMNLTYGTLVETASWESVRVKAKWTVMIDNATVVDADMMATNGIVHVIDTVLLPPSFLEMNGMMTDRGDMNIAEVAMWNDMFTTLVSAIKAADLAEMLMMDGPYTVFAPTNEAFTNLLEANHMSAQELLADEDMLKSVLSYHVVSGFYTSADIMGMDMNAMRKTANWASLDVDPMGKVDWATITKADIYASNGIIHVIDHVLVPSM